MPYDAELCAEQTLDMRGWFEAAKQRHAALGLTISEGTGYGPSAAGAMAHHQGQAEIISMWEQVFSATGDCSSRLQDSELESLRVRVGVLEAVLRDTTHYIDAAPYEPIRSRLRAVLAGGEAAAPTFKAFWIRNDQTGAVHSLGPMYGGTVDQALRKLESESLSYKWTLLAPVAGGEAGKEKPRQIGARTCARHGEYVADDTLLGCPDCAAEALAQERRERDARG